MTEVKFKKAFDLTSGREECDWQRDGLTDGVTGIIEITMSKKDLEDFLNTQDVSKIVSPLEYQLYIYPGELKKFPKNKDDIRATLSSDKEGIEIEVNDDDRYPSTVWENISIPRIQSFFEKLDIKEDKTLDTFIYRPLANGKTAIYIDSSDYGENVYRIYDAKILNRDEFEEYQKREEEKLVRPVSLFTCMEYNNKLYSCDALFEPQLLLQDDLQFA